MIDGTRTRTAPRPDAARARALFNHLAALTLAAAALLASAAAWADPPGRVGRVAETQGTVWMFDAEQAEWVAARRNRPVTTGDRLSVERGARAELQIGSATLRLDGGSELEINELGDRRVALQLHGGSLALRLRSNDSAREFSVTTAEGRFEPERAGHYRIDRRDNAGNSGSFAGVIAGTLRFEARDSVLEINAGQRAEFWSERGVTHYGWSALPNDRFADWVAQQDRQDQRDARQRYVSPEMTGADDLDRYGDWDRHPEYGTLWLPRRVAPGWAPYRYGQWSYVRPWGWTWVDDTPWGFAPFHYGRWVWWRDRWAWAPGQYVARPVYAPALVAWIGGPNVSIGINIGGGPTVGWVPLSPRDYYVPSYNVTNIYVTNVNGPYQRWLPPVQPVRTGPIMYTNQGVPGGVTVVSQQVLRERQPISNAVIAPVDARTISRWQTQPVQQAPSGGNERRAQIFAPPPPTARVVAAPGGDVPAAPGSARIAPWGQVAPPRAAGQSAPVAPPAAAVQRDAGEPQRGRPPLADPRGNRPPVIERPVTSAPLQREVQEQREQTQDNRGRDNRPPDARRIAPAAAAHPVQPQAPAQAAPPVQSVRPAVAAQPVPPGPPVVIAPAAPGRVAPPAKEEPGARGRGPKDADEPDDRPPPGQDRRRRDQQNQ